MTKERSSPTVKWRLNTTSGGNHRAARSLSTSQPHSPSSSASSSPRSQVLNSYWHLYNCACFLLVRSPPPSPLSSASVSPRSQVLNSYWFIQNCACFLLVRLPSSPSASSSPWSQVLNFYWFIHNCAYFLLVRSLPLLYHRHLLPLGHRCCTSIGSFVIVPASYWSDCCLPVYRFLLIHSAYIFLLFYSLYCTICSLV